MTQPVTRPVTRRVTRRAFVVGLVAANLILLAWAVLDRPSLSPASPARGARPAPSQPAPLPEFTGPVALAVDGSGAVLRVSAGSCDDEQPAARAWLAAPAGPVRAVAEPGLRTVGTAVVVEGDFVVVGRDDACRPAAARSADRGRSWRRVEVPAAWTAERLADTAVPQELGPDGRAPAAVEVRDPARQVHEPSASCDPVRGLSTTADGVPYLVCEHGAVLAIPRDAPTGPWELEGVRYASLRTPREGVALVTDPDCDARAYVLSDGGADWLPAQCLGHGKEPLGVVLGERLAVAQVGRELMVSSDGGRTWQVR